MKVRDSKGNLWPSIREAARSVDASHGHLIRAFNRGHKYQNEKTGITFWPEGEVLRDRTDRGQTGSSNVKVITDPLYEKLKERYSETELKQIAEGHGIYDKRLEYPVIRLAGEHHRILVMSDTHIGSIYSPVEWHDIVRQAADDMNVECILHCGDLVDGLKLGRAGTQIYELSEIGYDAQLAKAVEIFGKYRQPVYIISGNHDMYFNEFAGANIVKAFAARLDNVTYLGHDQADIIIGGATIRLFHGIDGNSYSVSYRLQKLAEAITGGHKPNIMLCGHVHKYCHILERNIHMLDVPCMQMQTGFMRGKKLAAHTGFLVLDFDTSEGEVKNLKVQLFPFYA